MSLTSCRKDDFLKPKTIIELQLPQMISLGFILFWEIVFNFEMVVMKISIAEVHSILAQSVQLIYFWVCPQIRVRRSDPKSWILEVAKAFKLAEPLDDIISWVESYVSQFYRTPLLNDISLLTWLNWSILLLFDLGKLFSGGVIWVLY